MPRQFGVPEDVIKDVCERKQKPSAYSSHLAPLHGRHVIGINNAYQIGDWIDVLFFGDCAWYNVYRTAIARWPGIKVTCCNRFENKQPKDCEGIKYLGKDSNHRRGISPNRSRVAWNGNSGCAAISLAAHLGVVRIILLGFDMALDGNKVSHWHGSHGNTKPPPFARHMLGFPEIKRDADARGIEIINASPQSAIVEFPKMSARELL